MLSNDDWKSLAASLGGICIGATLLTTAGYKAQVSGAAGPHTNQQVIYEVELPNKGLLQIGGLSLIAGSVGYGVFNVGRKKEESAKVLMPTALPVVTQSVSSPVNQYNHQNNYGFNPFQEQERTQAVSPINSTSAPITQSPMGNQSSPIIADSYTVDDVWDGTGYIAGNPTQTSFPTSGSKEQIKPIEYQHQPQHFEPSYPRIDLTKQLTLNDLSFALSGVPGAGKSTLLLAWLAGIIKANKNTQVFIVGTKADSWLGLSGIPGVFKRFYRDKENALVSDGFFGQVNIVNRILHERLGLPQKQRQGLHKVWLLLDDYFSISNTLDNCTDKETKSKWENAKAQLGEIITTGRECGVAMCVATQSLNIKSLGVPDANIRGCLGLCALARVYTDKNGRKEGGYSSITGVLRNNYIIPTDYTEEINALFNKLKPISEKTGRAIALTTCGEPEIGLFEEDLSWVEDYQIPISLPTAEALPVDNKKEATQEPGALEYLKELAKKNKFLEIPDDNDI